MKKETKIILEVIWLAGLIGIQVDKVDTVDNFHLYVSIPNYLKKCVVSVDHGDRRQRKKTASSTLTPPPSQPKY
jgi:hypothetical protein